MPESWYLYSGSDESDDKVVPETHGSDTNWTSNKEFDYFDVSQQDTTMDSDERLSLYMDCLWKRNASGVMND